MSKEEVYEIPLEIKGESGGETMPLTLRITVQGGNIARIEAVSGNKKYIGSLTLHEQSKRPSEGGDQCIICDPRCRIVSPCPGETNYE